MARNGSYLNCRVSQLFEGGFHHEFAAVLGVRCSREGQKLPHKLRRRQDHTKTMSARKRAIAKHIIKLNLITCLVRRCAANRCINSLAWIQRDSQPSEKVSWKAEHCATATAKSRNVSALMTITRRLGINERVQQWSNFTSTVET